MATHLRTSSVILLVLRYGPQQLPARLGRGALLQLRERALDVAAHTGDYADQAGNNQSRQDRPLDGLHASLVGGELLQQACHTHAPFSTTPYCIPKSTFDGMHDTVATLPGGRSKHSIGNSAPANRQKFP